MDGREVTRHDISKHVPRRVCVLLCVISGSSCGVLPDEAVNDAESTRRAIFSPGNGRLSVSSRRPAVQLSFRSRLSPGTTHGVVVGALTAGPERPYGPRGYGARAVPPGAVRSLK